jgi:hypothetical protein
MIPFRDATSLGAPKLLSRQDLIAIILRLEFEGWRLALESDVHLTNEKSEPYMNGRLYQGMVRVRDTLGLTNIYIIETPGVRQHPARALPQGAPDVIFLFAEFGANEPHAIIECKRIDPHETPKQLRGEYVRSGIDRFIDSAYGAGHDMDFMAGYLLSGTGDEALIDVNAYLSNVDRTKCHLHSVDAFPDAGFIAQSDHVRKSDGSSISLLHNFLSF